MTCLVLTAVAVLWPVIGLTVIGTVFLPLRALKMGHNAAVDLAAAVGWKPCNCNFPSSAPFLSSVLNADTIIYELSEFHDPRALETWSTANARFQKYMVVNEKMSPPFVIPEELFFCRYMYLPDSSVLLLLALRLEGKFGLKSASISAKTTHTQTRVW